MLSDLFDRLLCAVCNQWAWWWEASSTKDELARAVLTVSILIVAIFWYRWAFVRSSKGIGSHPVPPGPRGLPIVGYLPFLSANLHEQFTELAHQYGPIYKLWLGQKLYVVLNSPSLAKEVVRDQDKVFSNRDPPVSALVASYGGLDIVWAPHGSYWRAMRKVFVRDMMSNSSLEATYNLRKDEISKAIREVHSKIGTPVNIAEITFLTEMDVVMNMLWGSTVDIQVDHGVRTEFREVISKMVELLATPNLSDFFPVLKTFDIQGVAREMERLHVWVDRILDSIIDARMKMSTVEIAEAFNKKGKKDFLQILLELKGQEETGATMTLEQIKALLTDIVVGGTDTSATMVEWAMAEIMHNPEVMKKVQEELSDVVGTNNIVEESHVPKLHYLNALLKETFRLHPALPLLVPKRPDQSCIVGGYTIPKDTRVFLNVWAIHKDPEVWDSPSEFKPERFLGEGSKCDYNGNNFHYLPFGSGRRICAGLPLAEKMVIHLLASLLHSFNWHLPEGEKLDLSETFGIVMKKKIPLVAIPTQRLSSLKLYA
ncbi:Flavonoid 3',5'-hydroxylase [Actinidia chinensis var. chinensis]|uniref:Flavonoid 3',5'-hydroxylase n=1 Tax=Actinidia chinensis var. chinensis TaxID=1590841 RepID=A0A2R6PI48_ACTCC|nr:Flavonoid 3',5'-hydroxylase [Actinidia chinensis var. chinensis]